MFGKVLQFLRIFSTRLLYTRVVVRTREDSRCNVASPASSPSRAGFYKRAAVIGCAVQCFSVYPSLRYYVILLLTINLRWNVPRNN